jgi:hypothetical protein
MPTSSPKKEHFVLRASVTASAGADRVRSIVQDVLDRVARDVGEAPADVNVRANAGALSVAASPRFLRSLAEQPEVARRISPDSQPSLIEPVESRTVDLGSASGVNRRKTKPR